MDFNQVKTRNELADFLHVSRSKLTYVLFKRRPNNMYHTFTIPKKNGEPRTICAPDSDLKYLQRRIASALGHYIRNFRKTNNIVVNLSHAFEKDRSILTNAKIHKNKRVIVNVDLEDFFGSFHFGRVMGYFEKNRAFLLSHEVAVTLAQLACYKSQLPQGAPTSPIITNLICESMDNHLLSLAREYKMDYTRYADDITFSTNRSDYLDFQDEFLSKLRNEISSSGFRVNEDKTRIVFRNSRQEVTGVIVNKKLSAPKEFVRNTRAMANSLYRTGQFSIAGKRGRLNQLEGRFAFITQVDKYNNTICRDDQKKKRDLNHLPSREEQYRSFLFYRYFVATEKPSVFVEGKTDSRYLKAALKNLWKDYPELVSKKSNGDFEFKISFFHRTKKCEYLFGVNGDGADAMGVMYKYFTGKDGAKNYYEIFKEKHGCQLGHKTIFLFDNETKDAKHPLKKFITKYKISEADVNSLKTNLCLSLKNTPEIALMTNPLIKDEEEAIEALFKEELLSKKINGKPINLDNDYDKHTECGKNEFSLYVLQHYKEIDFSNFRRLLDVLVKEINPDKASGSTSGNDVNNSTCNSSSELPMADHGLSEDGINKTESLQMDKHTNRSDGNCS